MTVPPDVETLIAVSEWGGMVPWDFEFWKKDIPIMAVTKLIAKILIHPLAQLLVNKIRPRKDVCVLTSYESVKNPIPATTQART